MSDVLTPILLILLPAWLCCGLAWIWGRKSASARLSMILKASAVVWAVLLTLAFIAMIVPPSLCEGNWLYGYTECRGIAGSTANTLTGTGFIFFAIGAAFGIGLLIIGAVVEFAVRRR